MYFLITAILRSLPGVAATPCVDLARRILRVLVGVLVSISLYRTPQMADKYSSTLESVRDHPVALPNLRTMIRMDASNT